MKIVGIYKIQSKEKPWKYYIGSSVNIKKRWDNHLYLLRIGNHHSPMLQRHYNKYGISDLLFSIIEECPIDILIQREQYHLDNLKPLLNVCRIAGSCLGVKRNIREETRDKLRKNAKKMAAVRWNKERIWCNEFLERYLKHYDACFF